MLTKELTIGLVSAMLAAASTLAGAQEVSLRMSVNDRSDGHTAVMARDLADGVARRTNGALKIEVFPNHTLAGGNFKTEIELVRSGAVSQHAASQRHAGNQPER